MLILIENTNQIFVKNLQFLVHSWFRKTKAINGLKSFNSK